MFHKSILNKTCNKNTANTKHGKNNLSAFSRSDQKCKMQNAMTFAE